MYRNLWNFNKNSMRTFQFAVKVKNVDSPIPQATRPTTYHWLAMLHTSGAPPSPVQANLKCKIQSYVKIYNKLIHLPSFPASPPAHTKLVKSNWKFCPSLVALSCVWQVVWSTKGTSTSFWTAWKAPLGVKSFRPQPATQQRMFETKLLGKQAVVIVGSLIK